MNPDTMQAALSARKAKFLNFRWLLFIWLGALAALNAGTRNELGQGVYALFAAFILSQAGLWWLTPKHYDGMRVLNAIFLLDLNFVLLGFYVSHQVQPELLVALFLGTFMAALSKSLGQSIGTTVVIVAVYLGYKLRSTEGFHFGDPSQLLQLPFLFISSVHSSLLANEAAAELEARRVLSQDKRLLSRQMNSTFAEFARQCKDMSALVDALPFGAIMLDASGHVRVCNDIAGEVMGADTGALLDSPLAGHPRLSLLKPYLDRAVSEPLSDFLSAEIPALGGGSWTLNVGVYPVREGEETRGLLIVLIPQGYGDALKNALPKPLVLPSEAAPILLRAQLPGLPALAGMGLAEMGVSYG